MAVTRTFPAKTSLKQLMPIMNSLGAHVAAKLGHFGSDERTLTDDLCDMFYIWAQRPELGSFLRGIPVEEQNLINRLPDRPLDVIITKTTQQEEAAVGADLGLRVSTPLGVKRALMQAKVYDPKDNKLRCDSPNEWDRLWGQLVLMSSRSELAFFLIYVPSDKLNKADQGISTWEQGFDDSSRTKTSSKFGATLLPVNKLLDNRNNWRYPKPVTHLGNGKFRPDGISLGKLLLDMLLCRQGQWLPHSMFREEERPHPDTYPVNYVPYREISLTVDNLTEDEWQEFIDEARSNIEGVDLT